MFLPIKVSVRNYGAKNVGIILLEVWSPSGVNLASVTPRLVRGRFEF